MIDDDENDEGETGTGNEFPCVIPWSVTPAQIG